MANTNLDFREVKSPMLDAILFRFIGQRAEAVKQNYDDTGIDTGNLKLEIKLNLEFEV